MSEPVYSVTPYGQDAVHTSARQPGYVTVVGENETRTMRAGAVPLPIPSRRRPSPLTPAGGVELVRISPAVMRAALALADGDSTRLVLNADGSVTVLNRSR